MTEKTYGDLISREARATERLFFWLMAHDVEAPASFSWLEFDFEGSRFAIDVKELFRYSEKL